MTGGTLGSRSNRRVRHNPTGSHVIKDYKPQMSFADEASARFHDVRGDEHECVAFLRALAGRGPALELAVGTGRIALPLAAAGVTVQGIDFSEHMLERLRQKPGGESVPVQLGDFADVDVAGAFSLIFIVWNSFFNLLSQAEQVRCFQNVAAHLAGDGVFLIEAFVPAFLYRLNDNQQLQTESIAVDEVKIGALQHDAAGQRLEQNHVTVSRTGVRFDPVEQRYAWPAELDLMAQLAGLEFKARYADWHKTPFDSTSERHISIYGH